MVRDVKRSLRLGLRLIAHLEVPIGTVPRVVPLVSGNWRRNVTTGCAEEEVGDLLEDRRLLLFSDFRLERVLLMLSRMIFRPPKVLVRC